MEKIYQPQELEQAWYKTWEERGYFAPSGNGQPYCIVIPPPNVTGRLHMGHGFQHAIMDALTRYHRMDGHQALWQVGTDHAGIATQMVVERQLNSEGKSRTEIGRDAFIKRVWDWKDESGNIITQQLRRLGSSLDWTRERFTMDEELSSVVQKVFIDLYNEGLIYRGNRLVNWDPKLLTAISDLEVISEEEDGSLWYFSYPITDSNENLVIATTRPETLLGDTAVAVHPEDERYKHLIGQQVKLPICNRNIPIIADTYVDPAFGTGCVKITPAHDFNDYEMGLRHDLELINILTDDAAINEEAPSQYVGLDRFVARKKVVEEMKSLGLLEKIEPHRLKVPRGDRSGAIVEPYLTHQWYVSVESLAGPAITAVESGEIEFVPKNWENTYFAWMRDLKDWCISRQLWWGHRIPAWYDEEGKVYVGDSEEAIRFAHKLDEKITLHQDEDVLDTWFSSALWTFSTLGWPNETSFFDRFHPTNVLVTGFDIIFFWVARMIMMTLKFTGQVPFKKVYVTGLVRDESGQKMSKSKGNILDPIDLIDGIDLEQLVTKRTADMMQPKLIDQIEKNTRASFPSGIAAYGTDALRFTFYSLASTGRDIKFDLGRIEGHRNFCNKIWNAARYVEMNTDGKIIGSSEDHVKYMSIADHWIISSFEKTLSAVRHSLENYRFDTAAQDLQEFVWNEYCDWYVELSKPVLWDEETNQAEAKAARYVLLSTFEKILRLLHPFMPFITEELWQRCASQLRIQGESIMMQPYPCVAPENLNLQAEAEIDWIKGVVVGIRNIRGEMDISPAKAITVYLRSSDEEDKNSLMQHKHLLKKLAKLEEINWLPASEEAPVSAVQLYGNLEILVPMDGLIDIEAEKSRLNKELNKLQINAKALEGRLNNPKFVSNAPEKIVEKERNKLREIKSASAMLRQKKDELDSV
ncbi:MAG: valine--tRNA ligase [Gammaproteobacteria bacterium]|nr:valine--tRNA ligase [Gammaproteobacteria bacterium]